MEDAVVTTRVSDMLRGWLFACVVAFAAAGALVGVLAIELPAQTSLVGATGMLKGRVVFPEPSGPGMEELAPVPLRIGVEHPGRNDVVCVRRVRITAGQTHRAILPCTAGIPGVYRR